MTSLCCQNDETSKYLEIETEKVYEVIVTSFLHLKIYTMTSHRKVFVHKNLVEFRQRKAELEDLYSVNSNLLSFRHLEILCHIKKYKKRSALLHVSDLSFRVSKHFYMSKTQ